MYILNVHLCKIESIFFDRELDVCYDTQVSKESINVKTMYRNCILEFRKSKPYLLQVYLGAQAKIET